MSKSISGSISRRGFLKASASAAGVLALGSFPSCGYPPKMGKTKPNIVFIITDQQHQETISGMGNRYLNTPALDKICSDGVYFDQSYSTNPVCSPARSSMFTGRMPCETGVYENGRPIRSDYPNLGQWLSENSDYESVYAGKWHLPRSSQFDIKGFKVLTGGVSGHGMIGDTSVSRSCEAYIKNRPGDKPFFLVASFLQPHDICEWLQINRQNQEELLYPGIADELPGLPDNFEYDKNEPSDYPRYRKNQQPVRGKWSKQHWRFYKWSYYRMVEQVDGEIGCILQALDEAGIADNTIVIFTSDHGEGLGHHQMVRKNNLYDPAARVPLVVSYPGSIQRNVIDNNHLVSGLDIAPTICDYAGVPVQPGSLGKSLRPLLEGKTTEWHPYIVSEVSHWDYQLGRMVRTDGYKYTIHASDMVEQLFDMKNDPGETKNLAGSTEYSGVLKEHRNLLKEWDARMDYAPDVPENKKWPVS